MHFTLLGVLFIRFSFLINFTETASDTNIGHRRSRSWLSRLIPRGLGFFCCNADDAVIYPLDSNLKYYKYHYKSNSENEVNLSSKRRIVSFCVQINAKPILKDWISEFHSDIMVRVIDFLDRSDQVNLRTCNKALRNKVASASNINFSKHFRPRISTGFEVLERNQLAGILLSPYIKRLTALFNRNYVLSKLQNVLNTYRLSAEDRLGELYEITLYLGSVSDFESFIMMAVFYYNQVEPIFSWYLIEATVNAGLFEPSELCFLPNFSLRALFHVSCELGLLKLNQLLVKHHLKDLNVFKGILKSFKARRYHIYKMLVEVAKDKQLLTKESLHLIMEEATREPHSEYLRVLYRNFPQLTRHNSVCIFIAIQAKNIHTLQVILEHLGQSDLCICNEDGLNPFDLAAKINFWQGIHFMAGELQRPNVNLLTNSMRIAIMSSSTQSFNILMESINRFGPFEIFLTKKIIIAFIICALDGKNLDIVQSLLNNSPGDLLWHKELGKIVDRISGEFLDEYNPIFHAIENDYTDGFMLFINHFGAQILNYTDFHGRTPFLMAAACGNSSIVELIASMDPDTLHQKDWDGNNGLHLALFRLKDPIPFIKEVLDLNFDWDEKNNSADSALDLLIALPRINNEDLELIYSKYTSLHMND